MLGNFFADGDTGDTQLVTPSIVALNQDSDRVASRLRVEHARGGSDSAFEFVADHACSAAHVAFFGRHVEAVNIVEITVPCFGYDGQGPPIAFHVGLASLYFPGDDSVADHTNAVSVGDHNGTVQKARVLEPCCAGHFSVSVKREPCAKDGVIRVFSARMNCGDASSDRALADDQFAAARNQRRVPHFDTLDVGDRVVRARCAVEGDTEIACPWPALASRESGGEGGKE